MVNVTDVEIERRIPCNRLVVSAWEHNYNINLPDDLKEFYATTDGFKLTWSYTQLSNTLFKGDITINTLSALNRLEELNTEYGNWTELLQNISFKGTGIKPEAYILSSCVDVGKICLTYSNNDNTDNDGITEDEHVVTDVKKASSIWLLDEAYQWHLLAPSFTIYFRMALVHMGLPQWQLRFTPMGLTPSAMQIIMSVYPQLLQDNNEHDSSSTHHRNTLNLNIFKSNCTNVPTKQHKNN